MPYKRIIPRICIACGAPFLADRWQVKKGLGLYCGTRCSSPANRARRPIIPIADRFWAKVRRGETCWIWTGPRYTNGYGMLSRGRAGQGYIPAHRLSWELHVGPIPAGLWVLHRCDTPLCVNPDHLFLGTHAENIADRDAKNRVRYGDAHPCAKLTASCARAIRAAYAAGSVTMKELAERHGISRRSVADVIHRRTWKRA